MARLLADQPTAVRRVVLVRGIRGFADGFVSVLLAPYLLGLGLSPAQVGVLVTGTLLGSAVLTIGFGFSGHRWDLPTLLVAAAGLMVLTGLGFAVVTAFWPLLLIAVVGTLNPSGGDVSAFLPTEQALVAHEVPAAGRARVFATYNLAGALAGAFGALASGLPERLARHQGWALTSGRRLAFVAYAALGALILAAYVRGRAADRRAAPAASAEPVPGPPSTAVPTTPPARTRTRLTDSRRIVTELAVLFSVDSAGSGFVGTSILVLWLHLRFGLTAGTTAGVFFAVGLLGAASQLLAPRLAARIGYVRTMAFTHLPANALLVLAAAAPNGATAVALLLLRALFAQMDVPARQAFVMAVVPPHERTAASSVTNVPRSLAAAATPWIAGLLLDHSDAGWPLVIAGLVKIAYDLALLVLYRNVPEEEGAVRR